MGHDDVAMTCVNLVTYFDSIDFYEMVEDIYDNIDDTTRRAVELRMASEGGGEDVMDVFRVIKNFDQPAYGQKFSFGDKMRGKGPGRTY